jgi:hypothetical protein
VVCFDVEGVAKPPALATGYRQVVVEPSERHRTAEAQLRRLTGNVSISDIAASLLWRSTPEFSRALARELYDASAVICEQPYLAVAVAETDGEVPMILDAHNHEVTLKEQVLPNDEAGRWMLDKVTEVERIAAKRSVLVAASTEADLSPLQAMVANASKQPASMQTSVAPTQPGRATGRSGDLPQRWIVVPNGVDTSAIRFVTGDERAFQTRSVLAKLNAANFDHLVLFVGSAHAPNIAAGRWLAANAHLMPDSFVVLAGAHSDSVDTGGANNVRTLGTVGPDVLESLLSGASVAVNPMSGGSGSNLKLVEYFAAGAPVVSTPKGARGIDDPTAVAVLAPLASFVPALKETLAKPQSGKVLAARDLVESDFNWATLAQRFATSVTAALGPAASGAGLGNPRDGDPTSTSARP